MLSEKNELLTRVCGSTPAGNLLRSYWLPIALPEQLSQRNPMPIEVLGEKLALFRDGSGALGLVADRCAHRGTSLSCGSDALKTGRIDERGIRCCYHGWLYDRQGRCLEQPGEPADSRFHERVRIGAYPVEEKFGFIWAFLGKGPAPIIPPIDAIVRTDGYHLRTIGVWNCNYFQVCENLVDPVHATVLHVETAFEKPFGAVPTVRAEPTCLGMKTIAGRPGYEREVEILFPTGIRLAVPMRVPITPPLLMLTLWVVPLDDHRSLSFHGWFLPLPEDMPAQERSAKVAEVEDLIYKLGSSNPIFHSSKINAQDKFACESQGVITDRTVEHLGKSDVGVILLRKLFLEAIEDVRAGKDPRGVLRQQADEMIDFPNVS